MSRFIAVDRETAHLLLPSADKWLPQNHLARFVVEVIDPLELSDWVRGTRQRGVSPGDAAGLAGARYAFREPIFLPVDEAENLVSR